MNLTIPEELIFKNQHNVLNTSSLNGKLIVGCMGYSRSGKDTIAAELVAKHGYKRIAFGDTLKEEMNKYLRDIVSADLASKYIDIPAENINFLEDKDQKIKEILRPYMIWCGEELRRINGKFYWMHKAFEKTKGSDKIVISDIRRIDELDLFRGNMFSQLRQVENLIYAGHFNTEEVVNFNQKFESILFHVNQYKLEERDDLTVKAIQRAHEDWLFADTINIDSRIEVDKRKTYIQTVTNLIQTRYKL